MATARFSTNIAGAHVLVTGGSKGIGKSIVEAYLSEGANVSYCSRSATGEEFAKFSAAGGARASGSKVDIADAEQLKSWVDKAAEEFGGINIVVANASAAFQQPTIEHWQGGFQADVMGLIALIDAAAPHLEKNPGNASIVVISSLSAFESRTPAFTSPYPSMKRTQAILAKGYSKKLAPSGIRVNIVTPGMIETPGTILPDGTQQLSTFQAVKQSKPEYIDGLLKEIPLARPGAVEEVANVVLFLSSRLSSYVTGANLIIDGGMSIFF